MQPNSTSTTSPLPTVPAINITLHATSLNPDSFSDYLKQHTADALAAAFAPSGNVDIWILNVRAGSLLCDVVFAIMDGNMAAAATALMQLTALSQVSPYKARCLRPQ